MIVFRSMGGLGNQLFQYATARRLAHHLGTELVVDPGWHERRFRNTTQRPFELPRLQVKMRAVEGSERAWAWLASNRILGRVPLATPWAVTRERSFSFDESVRGAQDGSYLYGYWQSARYFEDIRELLVAELQPREAMSDRDRAVSDAMGGCESVFVHVRRGDFVSLAAAASNHGTCTPEYYAKACRAVLRQTRRPVMFVFSDDAAWAREHLKLDAETVFVDHNGPDAASQDLRLMTRCRHAILANSTFGWWGAWLGGGDDRVVVAPAKWFADGRPTPDLLPTSWTVL
jgi:hypothetical protein